jgi:hypothetical protein
VQQERVVWGGGGCSERVARVDWCWRLEQQGLIGLVGGAAHDRHSREQSGGYGE